MEEFRGVMRGGGDWVFSWLRNLFVWEGELLISLMEDLAGHRWENYEDGRVWRVEEGGIFLVRFIYKMLESLWRQRRSEVDKRLFGPFGKV